MNRVKEDVVRNHADTVYVSSYSCISLGPAHEGIAVVLVGALSKFVNQLPDDDEESWASASPAGETRRKRAKKIELDPRTQSRLRKLRVSLKLAIDHSLFKDQTRLVSSYCQVSTVCKTCLYALLLIHICAYKGFVHE